MSNWEAEGQRCPTTGDLRNCQFDMNSNRLRRLKRQSSDNVLVVGDEATEALNTFTPNVAATFATRSFSKALILFGDR